MANEITVTQKITLTKGNHAVKVAPSAQTFDQTGVGAFDSVQDIATSEESMAAFGDVTTEGWCYLRNLDAANFVQVGFATGVYGIRLEAGEPASFRCEPGLTLYLKANTAACNVRVVVFED
jgi:hypothetical protein